ncbi:hypothetical protein [Lichenibacterium dinghuense]|uniref:hypothetical protein n=1 Tax=Lichenibacterium dinghuense TaxID=2895977 RepID=UPI001F1605D6|nr:hypothetical protein [Lichenibacterium sp. 6Y81]
MAGALYRMDYQSGTQSGGAVVYIGDDGVTGTDVGGGIYSGSLVAVEGRVRGAVRITYPQGGTLVTGQPIAIGHGITINLDMPPDFGNGQALTIDMGGVMLVARLSFISPIPIPPSMSFSNPANSGLLPLL